MSEIDPAITDLLERARPAQPAAGADWDDVLARSRRRAGRRRRFPVPARGVLLAAAVLVGLGAVAQAETGVFEFVTNGSGTTRPAVHQRRLESIDSAVYLGILSGLPHGVSRGISAVTWTSAAKMARVFGGHASRYPPAAGVVVVRGPFSIPLYLQGCVEIPYACPAPIGRWAWLAYSVLPSPRTGPMANLPNVRLLRAAPSGTPLPPMAGLGHVTAEYVPPGHAYTVVREHQGAIVVVMRRGERLTEARIGCVYGQHGYTTPLCGALARYDAYLRRPHPNDAVPAAGDWTRVSGTLGGWRGNLVITADRLGTAPPRLAAAITRDLASTHGVAIRHVPPGIDCVVNPTPCYRSVPTKIHKVIDVLNRYGLDVRRIPPGHVPASYLRLVPHMHVEGAATNAGSAAVAARGAVMTVVFGHTLPSRLRSHLYDLLGRDRHWAVILDENVLTLYHPFYQPAPPITKHRRTLAALHRAFRRYAAQVRRDKRLDRVAYAVIRGLDRLTTTR